MRLFMLSNLQLQMKPLQIKPISNMNSWLTYPQFIKFGIQIAIINLNTEKFNIKNTSSLQ